MARKTRVAIPAGVERLRKRIERWRRTRRHREAMPPELWAGVVRLARDGKLYAVARALGLNAERLKQRVQGAGGKASATPAGAFVELSGAELLGAAPPAAGPVVELLDRQGCRLTVRLPAEHMLDVGRLLCDFRSHCQ